MDRQSPWGRQLSSLRRRANSNFGQALVEFALLLPILVMLTVGAVDFARAFFSLQVVTNASREGARAGVVLGATSAQVTVAMNNVLATGGMSATPSYSIVGVDGAVTGTQTTITVTYPFQTLAGTIIPGWGGVINLTQTTVMRHE